jgi:Cu(I)/Ag(I) efflux system membrane fusion protein
MKQIFSSLAVFAVWGSLWAGPIDSEIDRILVEYFKIQRALARDTTKGVAEASRRIADLAATIRAEGPAAEAAAAIHKAAAGLTAPDLDTARQQFFALSRPLLEYLHQHYQGGREYFRYFCSMARKGWVQEDEEVRNPYHGTAMLTCGERIG